MNPPKRHSSGVSFSSTSIRQHSASHRQQNNKDRQKVEERGGIIISVVGLLQEFVTKSQEELDDLLQMDLTIADQILKSSIIRDLQGSKLLAVTVCELVIFIKENSLQLSSIRSISPHGTLEGGEEKKEIQGDLKGVIGELDEMVKSIISETRDIDRYKVRDIEHNLNKIQKKLNRLFVRQNSRNKAEFKGGAAESKQEHERILGKEKAIRELIEQELESNEKEVVAIKNDYERLLKNKDAELALLKAEVSVLKGQLAKWTQRDSEMRQREQEVDQRELSITQRELEVATDQKRRDEEDVDQVLGSDMLPFLLIQGISLQNLV